MVMDDEENKEEISSNIVFDFFRFSVREYILRIVVLRLVFYFKFLLYKMICFIIEGYEFRFVGAFVFDTIF